MYACQERTSAQAQQYLIEIAKVMDDIYNNTTMKELPLHIEQHVTVDSNQDSALDLLANVTGLSKTQVKLAMNKGAVWLTRRRQTSRLRRAKKGLRLGDVLHLYYDKEILNEEPALPVMVADNTAYSVWYKPYGARSQGSKWGDHCTVHRWVEQNLKPQRPAFVVHRLDRAATGLILIAHQKRMATALSQLFEARDIEKIYQVIVHGRFPNTSEPVILNTEIDDRDALSLASLQGYSAEQDRSLVEVKIETGRKHQIRIHLSELGFPVVGDRLYGHEGDREDLQLAACSLAFCCPVSGEKVEFELPEKWKPKLA